MNVRLFQYSLAEKALHEMAKTCWGDYVTEFQLCDEEEFSSVETAKLIAHRKSAVNKIPVIFPYLPKCFMDSLVDAIIFIQRGFSEALVCTNKYKSHIQLMSTYPLSSGPYSAKNFIDPSGCFDELKWAKRFVRDGTQSVFRRFTLACFYCFEDEIKDLWILIKKFGKLRGLKFEHIEELYGVMVWMWTQQLEGRFTSPNEFHSQGFAEANDKGFEHASRFFWERCSDSEKSQVMSEIEDYDLLNEDLFSDPSHFKYDGHVHFFYSLLSKEQKIDLVHLTAPIGAHFLWSRLLVSRFHESVLRDVLTLSFPSSSPTYAYILRELTVKMVELPIPVYKKTFEVLWKSLSETDARSVLERNTNIVWSLMEIQSIDLLQTVILHSGPTEKVWMLLNDWQFAGISALNEFLRIGDYDGLHRYLLLFLTYRVSGKLRVRVDAIVLLSSFIKKYNVFFWSYIPESVRNEVIDVFDSIQGSLFTLSYLQETVVDELEAFPTVDGH